MTAKFEMKSPVYIQQKNKQKTYIYTWLVLFIFRFHFAWNVLLTPRRSFESVECGVAPYLNWKRYADTRRNLCKNTVSFFFFFSPFVGVWTPARMIGALGFRLTLPGVGVRAACVQERPISRSSNPALPPGKSPKGSSHSLSIIVSFFFFFFPCLFLLHWVCNELTSCVSNELNAKFKFPRTPIFFFHSKF